MSRIAKPRAKDDYKSHYVFVGDVSMDVDRMDRYRKEAFYRARRYLIAERAKKIFGHIYEHQLFDDC